MHRRKFSKATAGTTLSIGSLNPLEAFVQEQPRSERMPALFLGHGSPMIALDENHFVQGFRAIEKTIPKPKAILCVSTHWFTRGTKVTAMKQPETARDFGGFPKTLHEFQYPAPGSQNSPLRRNWFRRLPRRSTDLGDSIKERGPC